MNKKTPNLRLLDKTEEKDHTRKPVIRDPLPEKDQITLCELVTWRAIGKAWPARRLKGLMKRNRGQRKPAFLWESFEREAATVVSLCGKGDLSPAGSVDGNPRQPFSEGYFLSDVYADFVSDSIGPDLLAWPSAQPYPDENPEEPKELPTYYGVQFFRSDLLSTFEPAAETDQVPAWGTQDDAALALEMVSARGTGVKPATPAVLPEPAVIAGGASRASEGGRPTLGPEIEAAYKELRNAGDINFDAPKIRLYEPIREKVREYKGDPSLQRGLGNEAIRKVISPLFEEDKNKRSASA
jgi:hypothetical protein